MLTKPKLVVIGNGMAGIRTVETLLDCAPDLYDITVFGSEPYGNYNRILLSLVLGECVQHRRQTYGLVAPLFDQAKVAPTISR